MKSKIVLMCALMLSVVSVHAAVAWRNLDAEHYLGGRKASVGYLQGKAVFVVRWRADAKDVRDLLKRIEEVWEGFKTKQLVVLAGPCAGVDAAAAKEQVSAAGVTFPVYADAGLGAGEPVFESATFLYVVDETGKVVYRGQDDRTATQALVSALTDMDAPRSPKQWKRFLDYELANLPGHGYLRLKEFHKRFPKEAREYTPQAKELAALPNLKALADLVAFAKRAKDAPVFTAKDKAKMRKYQSLVNEVLEKCEPLKGLSDPRMAQEAKNALADLKWIQATF